MSRRRPFTKAGIRVSVPQTPPSTPGEKTRAAPLPRTFALARPEAGRLLLATLLGAGALGGAIGLITTSAWLISRSSQRPPESVVAVAIVGVQFFALARGLCRYFERLVGHDAAFRVLSRLRVSIYERLERLAPLGLPAFRNGELLARLVHDVDSLQDLLLRVVPPFAVALLVGAGTVVLMWTMLPAAGLIVLVALLLAGVFVPWLTGTQAARREARQAHARGLLTASIVDLIESSPELLVWSGASAQLGRTLRADRELTAVASAGARTAGIGQGLTRLCCGLAMWGALLVGIAALRAGRLDGVLLAGLALIPLVAFELVTGLPGATQTLQRVRRAAARVQEVIEAPEPVVEPDSPLALGVARLNGHPSPRLDVATFSSHPSTRLDVATLSGHPSPTRPFDGGTANGRVAHSLKVRGLCSSYPRAQSAAITGIDLDLTPGRRVAVVGPSGAGKSTLAAVLLRFLPYQGGSVTLDGLELALLDGDESRRVVGLVGQDAHVFDSTLEENLRLARRDATSEQLLAALAGARLLDWVEQLPDGLATELGEHGARMSGGQRQRLALARALLADFPILILDEPTEHLDGHMAEAILAQLLQGGNDRATLLITHRLSGLERVDEIIVLEHGCVRERGTHAQLVAHDGHYAAWFVRESGNGLRG